MTKAKIRQSPKLPAQQRREQLLESARRLFTEKGYRNASTEEIAANAGVTKGALYFHFASKDDILLALVKMMTEHFERSLAVLPKPLTPWRIIENQLRCEEYCTPREFRGVMDIWVQALNVPKIRRFIDQYHRRMVEYALANMDPSLRIGRTEMRHLLILVFSACDGLAAHRVFDPNSVEVPAQVRLIRSLAEALKHNKGRSTAGVAR